MPQLSNPIIVTGCERSGTTMMGSYLGDISDKKYNELKALPASYEFISYFDMWSKGVGEPKKEALRSVEDYLKKFYGEGAVVDKQSLTLFQNRNFIRFIEKTIDPKFVYMIRDPRYVVQSILLKEWGTLKKGEKYTRTLHTSINQWKTVHRKVYPLMVSSDKAKIVRYEELCSDPGIAYDVSTWCGLTPNEPIHIRNQKDMLLSDKQVSIIERSLSGYMKKLGYL